MANITPIFKRQSKNKKKNFGQVSILPVLLRISEKNYMVNNYLLSLKIFSQNFNVDSKAFNCLSHDLLIEKLHFIWFIINISNSAK